MDVTTVSSNRRMVDLLILFFLHSFEDLWMMGYTSRVINERWYFVNFLLLYYLYPPSSI